jgi:UDP-2,3-diacylglucosamine pyrophosphatase LpxH
MRILVISDVHLGSPLCKHEDVKKALLMEFDKLVINGDLFDSHKFGRYGKKDWEILGKIRKLSQHIPVIFILGNHDKDGELLAEITGMQFVNEYEFDLSGKKYFLCHGDIYDSWIGDFPVLVELICGVYYFIQRLDKNQRLSRWLKRSFKQWVQAKNRVANNFLNDKKGYDYLIAGHTHHADIVTRGGTTYLNGGSFCEVPSTAIMINEFGPHFISICESSGIKQESFLNSQPK